MLTRWDQASPALQAALAKPLASRLDTFCQLRYRALASLARIPSPPGAGEHARALPSLLWPGWALRLMPPRGLRLPPLPVRVGVLLAVASAGAAATAPPRNCSACSPSTATGSPASPPGCASTGSWNR